MTGKESIRRENEEGNPSKKSTPIRGKETELDTIEQGEKDAGYYKQKQDIAETRHRNLTLRTSTAEEQEQNNNGEITDRIVTIQTEEGRYEARLVGDNSNDSPSRNRWNSHDTEYPNRLE